MTGESNTVRIVLARPAFTLDVDLALPQQGITVLFGVSGSGKTTLLRCVAGLERAPTATVRIAGEVWQDEAHGVFLPVWRRPLGYVFQEASLFDHLDVAGNLNYGVRRAAPQQPHSAVQAGQALQAAVELLGIGPLLQRRTQQLSGGERQRVAIARALAMQPRLLLLDEPLASLDVARRQEILPWLERLRDELHIPMLYVTHAQDELTRLADTLVVLESGTVKAVGPVSDVLNRVQSPVIVGEGAGALLQGVVQELDQRWHLARVDFAGGSLWLRDTGLAVGQSVRLRVLARDVSIATQQTQHTSIQNLLPCVVQSITPDQHPSQVLLQLQCGDSTLMARITGRAVHTLGLAVGSAVWAQVKSVALVE